MKIGSKIMIVDTYRVSSMIEARLYAESHGHINPPAKYSVLFDAYWNERRGIAVYHSIQNALPVVKYPNMLRRILFHIKKKIKI